MNKAYFIDLDDTLISNPAKWWIVDKKNPANYILRINKLEAQLILQGFYKSNGYEINYNGLNGWISQDLYNKILKKKNIKPEDIGISFREYLDVNLIESQIATLIIHIDNIKHLKGKTINLLTARSNKKAHQKLIDNLNTRLSNLDINIDKEYFISDPTIVNSHGSIGEKKVYVLLEHLLGYKIDNNQFKPILVEQYNEIDFYDDEETNLEACNNIHKIINNLLKKSEPFMTDKIRNKISLNDIVLNFYLIGSNEVNMFNKFTIKLDIGSL